jgi:hypothetical protein
VAELLTDEGLAFPLPSLVTTSTPPGRREKARVLVKEVAPWVGRRVREAVV